MLYVTGGLIALAVLAIIIIIAKLNGKLNAELDQSNDNVEVLKEYAEIDALYDHTPIDSARDSMRDKVRNNT